jgi:hypothetical protein
VSENAAQRRQGGARLRCRRRSRHWIDCSEEKKVLICFLVLECFSFFFLQLHSIHGPQRLGFPLDDDDGRIAPPGPRL